MISKLKNTWKKYNLGFYFSIASSFIMGTFHLAVTCISFSWLTFNYMLFCYLMLSVRIVVWYLDRIKHQKNLYLTASIFLIALLIPLMVSLVRTIKDKEINAIIFDWIIYAYAIYAFAKLIVSLINLAKSKTNSDSKNILCWFSLINALFTMFMLEFNMIRIFGKVSPSMQMIEYFFQGFILLLVLFVISLFLFRFFVRRKQNHSNES